MSEQKEKGAMGDAVEWIAWVLWGRRMYCRALKKMTQQERLDDFRKHMLALRRDYENKPATRAVHEVFEAADEVFEKFGEEPLEESHHG